jgi:hypothetical protein
MAGPALRRGEIERVIHTAVISHHLIEFTRQCRRGMRESSVYAPVVPSSPAAAAS